MKNNLFLIGSLLISSCITEKSSPHHLKDIKAIAPISSKYKLHWQDEFNGNKLDNKTWRIRVGKRKRGFLTPDAISVSNGTVKITTRIKNDKIYIGAFDSIKKLEFKYGHFEARVKLQTQIAHWSAFWLNSRNIGKFIGNPADSGVEIDVFEYLKRKGNYIQNAIHWNGYKEHHKLKAKLTKIEGIQKGWHTFSVTWDEKGYTFYVDGKQTWKTNENISKTPQYIIFSAETSKWAGDINKAKFPDTFHIDYIRIFKKIL